MRITSAAKTQMENIIHKDSFDTTLEGYNKCLHQCCCQRWFLGRPSSDSSITLLAKLFPCLFVCPQSHLFRGEREEEEGRGEEEEGKGEDERGGVKMRGEG